MRVSDGIEITTLAGPQAQEVLPALSRLRCDVFRAWPYLYDGTAEYEEEYLSEFARAGDSVIVVARDGPTIVGAATSAPLMSHTSEFAPLFAQHGFAPEQVYYFGESVLLDTYRGRGIGHAFFDAREAAARTASAGRAAPFSVLSFCGVVRASDDPRRPADARELAPFWMKRGFEAVAGMVGIYDWQEIGRADEGEIAHPMQFWVRRITP